MDFARRHRRRPHWRYDSPSEHHAHSLSSFLRSRERSERSGADISTLDSRGEILADIRLSTKEPLPLPSSVSSNSESSSTILSSLNFVSPATIDVSRVTVSPLPSPLTTKTPPVRAIGHRHHPSTMTASFNSSKTPKTVATTANSCSSTSTITDDVVAALGALASSPPPPPPPTSAPAAVPASSSSASYSPMQCQSQSPGLTLSRPYSWGKRVASPTPLPAPVAKRRDLHGASRTRNMTSLPTLVRAAEAFAAADPQHGTSLLRPRGPPALVSSTSSSRKLSSLVVPPPPPLVAPTSHLPSSPSVTGSLPDAGLYPSLSASSDSGRCTSSSRVQRSTTASPLLPLPSTSVTPPPPPPPPVSALAPLPLPLDSSSTSSSSHTVHAYHGSSSQYSHQPMSLFSRSDLGGARVHSPFSRSLSHSPTHARSVLSRRARLASNINSPFSRLMPRALTLPQPDAPSAFSNGGPLSSGASSSTGVAARPLTPPPTLANALAAQMQRHSALSRPGISFERTPLSSTSHCLVSHATSQHIPPPPPLSTMPTNASTTGSMALSHPSAFISANPVPSSSTPSNAALTTHAHQNSLASHACGSAIGIAAATTNPEARAADIGSGGNDSDVSMDSLDPANMSVTDMQDFMIECTDNGDLESLVNLAKKAGRLVSEWECRSYLLVPLIKKLLSVCVLLFTFPCSCVARFSRLFFPSRILCIVLSYGLYIRS